MVKVKICGITNISDAYSAAECGVDALGFIFYPKSQRYVAPAKAKEMIQKLPSEIVRVGVFVNHEIEEVKEIARSCSLHLIQLHGDESPEYCGQFPMSSLIKAVSCQTEEEIRELRNYPVAAILVDARDKGNYGGTGKNSDWRLAIKVKEMHPLILAGGLNRENIKEAIERVRPQAVDLNSGVEIYPGKKDPNKISEIMKIVHETELFSKYSMGIRGENVTLQSWAQLDRSGLPSETLTGTCPVPPKGDRRGKGAQYGC